MEMTRLADLSLKVRKCRMDDEKGRLVEKSNLLLTLWLKTEFCSREVNFHSSTHSHYPTDKPIVSYVNQNPKRKQRRYLLSKASIRLQS